MNQIKVQLGNTDYEINGLTIDQWETINKWQQDETKWSNSDLIALMLNVQKDTIRQATIQQINFVGNFLQKYVIEKSQRGPLKQIIIIDDEVLGLVKPSQLTYGEYVDLETLMSMTPLNFKHIASILYRPTSEYNEETGDFKIVPYDYEECVTRSDKMGGMFMGDVLSSIFFLTSFNKELIEGIHESMVNRLKKKTTE